MKYSTIYLFQSGVASGLSIAAIVAQIPASMSAILFLASAIAAVCTGALGIRELDKEENQ